MKRFLALVALLVGTWFALPASTQTTIANNAADMAGKIVMVADSATGRTVTNLFTFDRGAAVPFAVGASSLKVTNLDADKLDGLDSVRYKQAVVTTTATGTQNNFDPSSTIAGGSQIVLIRCNNAADLTVTGLVAGIDGQIVIFYDIGSFNVFFQDASGGAGSTVELQNMATSGATPISTRGFAAYVYDTTTGIWRLFAHEQGTWITPTYAAGTYTATGGGTWTVDAGDVTTFRYRLSGKTLSVVLQLDTTTIVGTVSAANVTLPNSYVSTSINTFPFLLFDNSATVAVAASARVAAAGTSIGLQFLNIATNYTASANGTYIRAAMAFEVN
jgi:hypothetical protein